MNEQSIPRQVEEEPKAYEVAIRQLLDQVSRRNKRLTFLASEVERLNRNVAGLETRLTDLTAQLAERDQTVTGLQTRLTDLTAQLAERDQTVTDLQTRLTDLTAQLAERDQTVAGLQTKLADLTAQLAERDQTVADLQTRLEVSESTCAARESQAQRLYEQHGRVTAALHTIETSLAWKVILRYRTALDRLAPPDTRRRQVYRRMILGAVGGYRRLRGRTRTSPAPAAPPTSAPAIIHRGEDLSSRGTGKGVDIIVPVYNGLQYLKECLDSILKHTDLSVHGLLLIDDASTEPGILEYLADFHTRHSSALNITLVRHDENQGFVRTANEGFRRSARDVVLLNTDTIVTAGWVDKLERAAYSDWRIATVTPFSNNATICSVPEFAKKNELPPGHAVDSFGALIERVALRYYPRLPTAVGFCMYIRRKALDEIGLFDEVRFGRGYGEENDFCLRASRQGWDHVLDDATFVYHKGGVSFTDDVKRTEEQKHLVVLDQLYPYYLPMVHRFIAENPLSYLHQHLQSWLRVQGASGR